MHLSGVSFALGLTVLAAALGGCRTDLTPTLRQISGESVVFIGEEPAALAFPPQAGQPWVVRDGYADEPGGVTYEIGLDYAVDIEAGTLWRLPGSRIPDFRTNNLFGQEEFDHSRFPGFGNGGYFAFVDYRHRGVPAWPVQRSQAARLSRSVARLTEGGAFKVVAYGDSITAGGDATRSDWIFWNRWVGHLRAKYPQAQITVVNGATGGDSTVQGLERLQAKVLEQEPDLVLVGFGMNDHNKGGPTLEAFEANLKLMIARIRESTSAEVILFSAFPPNPKWKFGSHRMEQYAASTERVAEETGCAFADVYGNWVTFAARKKPEDLLGNNINHPNDFGHWLYYRVLVEIGL